MSLTIQTRNDDEDLFAHEVAAMALYLYARAAVGTIAARLYREPLLLPVVEHGGFELVPEQSQDSTS